MMVTSKNILEKPIAQVLKLLQDGVLTRTELLDLCLSRIEKIKCLNAFITTLSKESIITNKEAEKTRSTSIQGIPFSVKDNFSTNNLLTTCASVMLKNYVPTYTATVVNRLQTDGAVLVGKTNMDEFAMGSGSVNSCFGPARNPWKYEFTNDSDWHVAGGSSGGSAVAVATGASYFALGSDTGGSVRIPAALCGIVGLKPTYGALSRHGLITLVNSMDVPGIFTRNVDDCALVFNSVSGRDVLDSTTVATTKKTIKLKEEEKVDKLVVGIPKEYHGPGLAGDVLNVWRDAADIFANAGAIVKEVSLPHTQFSIVCYHVLSCSEVASNYARYDGLQYGHRSNGDFTEELFAKTRNEGFNEVVTGRIMAGNYFLLRKNYKNYFDKATRVRRLITQDFNDVFNQGVDVLLTPVTISTAPLYSEFIKESNSERTQQHDIYTQAANIGGFPAISVPAAISPEQNLPIGMQLIGNSFQEETLLKAAKFLESAFNCPRLKLE